MKGCLSECFRGRGGRVRIEVGGFFLEKFFFVILKKKEREEKKY